jgi:hypothetical protein
MASDGTNGNAANDLLYHVKRIITNFHSDMSGATRTTDILGTYTSLLAAKSAARTVLEHEGYTKDDFAYYAENDGTEGWKHGDGVIVFAKAPAGQAFEVCLDTKPNVNKFKGNAETLVEGHLHYVLQTTIQYNNDRIGGIQSTEVEGTYATRKAAYEAAKTALLGEGITKESFAEWDEKDNERNTGEWPYGDEVLVHAVGQTGENFLVAVKAQPGSHQHHERKTGN